MATVGASPNVIGFCGRVVETSDDNILAVSLSRNRTGLNLATIKFHIGIHVCSGIISS